MDHRARWGRTITIEMRRSVVAPTLFLIGAGLLAMGLFLLQIDDDSPRAAKALFAGWLSLPLAAYIFFLAMRVATYRDFQITLTRTGVSFPSLHGFFAHHVDLRFTDIQDVGYVEQRGSRSSAVWSGGKRYGVGSTFWLPKEWSVDDVTQRVNLRWHAARLGLAGPELAAVEAAFEDAGAGIAVRQKGKKWKVLGAVADAEDFEARFGDRDEVRMILAADVFPAWEAVRDMPFLPKPKQGLFG
ncbi:MAG: hypothetical protein AB7S26_22060 [Sandaracinaceae bacterium]